MRGKIWDIVSVINIGVFLVSRLNCVLGLRSFGCLFIRTSFLGFGSLGL